MSRWRLVAVVALLPGLSGCWQTRTWSHQQALTELAPPPATVTGPSDRSSVSAMTGTELLNQWLRAALANHPAIAAAQAEVRVARAEARVADLPRNPELRLNNEIGGDPQTSDRLALAAQVWLPNPAVQGAISGGARARIPMATAAAAALAWQARHQLTLAWVQVVVAKQRLVLAQEQAALHASKAAWLAQAARSGAVRPVEAEWAELARMQSAEAVLVASEQGQLAAASLQAQSRLPADHPAQAALLSLPDTPDCATPPAVKLEPTILAQHPLLLAQAAAWQVADAEVEVERGRYLPSLHYIQLGVQRRALDGRTDLRFGGALEIPVFSWFGHGVAAAEAERDKTRLAYSAQALTLWQLVQDRALTWQTAAGQWQRLQTAVVPAQQAAVERAKSGVASGSWTQLLVFEAQQRVLDSRKAQMEAWQLCQTARYETLTALGGPLP